MKMNKLFDKIMGLHQQLIKHRVRWFSEGEKNNPEAFLKKHSAVRNGLIISLTVTNLLPETPQIHLQSC